MGHGVVMRITIPDAVKQMLAIVEQLCAAYPKKKFTLDGRLVGDIGEVLVGGCLRSQALRRREKASRR